MSDVAGTLRQAVKEGGDEFFERREHIEMLIITLLARLNAFLLGEPGTAKSALCNWVCNVIDDATFYAVLFDKQLPVSELFGQYDPGHYKTTGKWVRDPTGRVPEAHVFFGDEVGKAGPATLNPLLTAINERVWYNGGETLPIPMLMHVGASNEELEMPELAALWDRYMVRLEVLPIQEPGNFQSLLWSAVKKPAARTRTKVALNDLQDAIENDVPAIDIPVGVMDKVMQLRADLTKEGIKVGDRRWKQAMRVIQASAYLNGRSAADEDDLLVLQHVLWESLEAKPTIVAKVLANASATTKWALDTLTELSAHDTRLDGLAGQATDKKAAAGADINHKLELVAGQYEDKVKEAEADGRSTVKIEQVLDQIKRISVRVMVEVMGIPEDRARKVIEDKY